MVSINKRYGPSQGHPKCIKWNYDYEPVRRVVKCKYCKAEYRQGTIEHAFNSDDMCQACTDKGRAPVTINPFRVQELLNHLRNQEEV